MKRIFLSIIFVLIFSSIALALTVPGTELSDDGAAWSGAGLLEYIYIRTDGTNALTIVAIYDNDSAASGRTLFVSNWVVTTSSSDRERIIVFPKPIPFSDGLYFNFTCAGTFAARPYVTGRPQ